jgi:hypothetical protein
MVRPWNYQITVKGKDNHQNVVTKVYKTIDMIADMSSNLHGRATRVYEAYEVRIHGWMLIAKEGDSLSEILDDASDKEKRQCF